MHNLGKCSAMLLKDSGAKPEMCNRRAVLEVWGRTPQLPEANGGLGVELPAAKQGQSPKILHFFAKRT